MTLDEMNILVTFSKYSNYQQCASLCGINRTTVSRVLQKIEKEYGILLFTHTSTGFRFTEDGMNLIRTSYAILQSFDQMKEQLNQHTAKPRNIKIGILPPLMPCNLTHSKRFQHASKSFPISIIQIESNQNLLETGEIDFIYGIEGIENHMYMFSELGRDNLITIFENKENDVTYLSQENANLFHPIPNHFQLIDMDDYNLTLKYLLEHENICIWYSESNYLHTAFQFHTVDQTFAIHRHYGLYYLQRNTDPYILNFIANLKREDR